MIPQRTVDNNLTQDRLAGPKALYPNHSKQSLHDVCLIFLTVYATEFRLFGVKVFPPYLISRFLHSSSRYNF